MGLWERLHRALIRDKRINPRIKDVQLSAKLTESAIQFGDRVRILSSEETERRGLAGKIGEVYGQTTPSVTSPVVIGCVTSDYAVNVFFEDIAEQHWFAEQLLELVDHNDGAAFRLEGHAVEWVRTSDGGWVERPRA